jgi:ankyrin repeat protein
LHVFVLQIRTIVGTTASLPVGCLEVDPEAERRLKIKYEASVAHDMAALTIEDGWRTCSARSKARKVLRDRRNEREANATKERAEHMQKQKNLVEQLAVIAIQALIRGVIVRHCLKLAQLNAMDESGYDEEDPEVAAAASMLAAHYRGSSERRRRETDCKAAEVRVPQTALESGVACDQDLLKACASGDLHGVHVLTRDHGVNVHVADKKGNSGLMLASAGGNLDVVRYLASMGASLTIPNYAGWSPLHRACFNGCLEVVNFLLASSPISQAAALAGVNHFGSTPLHVAIPRGHLAVAELLVEKGCSLESRNTSGDTPLNFAVVCRQQEIVAMLLEKGADRNTVNDEGRTPVESAVATGQPDLAALISEQEAAVPSSLSRGTTAAAKSLKSAAKQPHLPQAQTSQSHTVAFGQAADDEDDNCESARIPARLFVGCSAPSSRISMVGSAWVQAAREAAAVSLRPHEAATVLDVLGLLDSPPLKSSRGSQQPEVTIRLDSSLHTAQDLGAVAPTTAPEVTSKHGHTARKKLLSLIRCPKGAAAFVAERKQSVAEWSDATGRAFLRDVLDLPAPTIRTLSSADGLNLLALDIHAIEAAAANLPSILKHRLAFHCELLRAVASAEDSRRVVVPRAVAKFPITASTASIANEMAEKGDVDEEKGYSVELDGGWLADGYLEDGVRVQVAYFSDLALAMRRASDGVPGGSLLAEDLLLARRAAASKGTVTSALLDDEGRVLVLLDDGLTASLPPTALYAIPNILLHPAQLRVGAFARIVHAAWLRQLLLTSNVHEASNAMGDVNALAERLGGAIVTVIALDKAPGNFQRVKVKTGDGYESGWLPADALVPPPSNAAMRLMRGKATTKKPSVYAKGAAANNTTHPAAARPSRQRPLSAPSRGKESARRLYRTEPQSTQASVDPFGTQLPFVPSEMLKDQRVRDQIGRQGSEFSDTAPASTGHEEKGVRPQAASRNSEARVPALKLTTARPDISSATMKTTKARPKSAGGRRSSWVPVAVQTFEFGRGVDEIVGQEDFNQKTSWRPAASAHLKTAANEFDSTPLHETRPQKSSQRPASTRRSHDWSFRRPGTYPGDGHMEYSPVRHGRTESADKSIGSHLDDGDEENDFEEKYGASNQGYAQSGDEGVDDDGGLDSDSAFNGFVVDEKTAQPLRELVRERVETLVDDEMDYSTGGWSEHSYGSKLRAMEDQMARREDELQRRANGRVNKARSKHARYLAAVLSCLLAS